VKNTAINIILGLLAVLATILAALIGLYAVGDAWSRGANPPKRLVIGALGVVDPLIDLRAPGADLTISLKAGEAEIRTLRLAQVTITNQGKAPILPSDFVEPLAVTTTAPWRIVAVANAHQDIGTLVPLTWSKASDTEFDARPTLLNPGDQAWVAVYLTNDAVASAAKPDNPTLNWKARIINLKAIESPPSAIRSMQGRLGWIQVYIWGWGVPFVLLSFGVYVSLSLLLFSRAGLLQPLDPLAFGFLITAILINLAAAEAGGTYVFNELSFIGLPATSWLNAPPLIVNFGMLIILFFVGRTRQRQTVGADG
jgi:hypothetical protein